jgi:hypothetical protein
VADKIYTPDYVFDFSICHRYEQDVYGSGGGGA